MSEIKTPKELTSLLRRYRKDGPEDDEYLGDVILAHDAALRAERDRLRAIVERFLTTGSSLGASHPHLSSYVAYDDDLWKEARAEIGKAAALAGPEGEG